MVSPNGFKVSSISVEGFKGFTTQQQVEVDGRHLFIIGRNGLGKSSIIEAVRWGLFGSLRRPNEIITNQTYTGACRVEIGLRRGVERLRLRRTAIRGQSGGSDAEILDENGSTVPIRDVLPQIESARAGEGMHIVYAAQAAPHRRQAEDLTPFERTVFAYLGLSDVPVLRQMLSDFITDQEDMENALGAEVTEKHSEVQQQIDKLEERRDQYIASAPWGGGGVPDVATTSGRIRDFCVELNGVTRQHGDLADLIDQLADDLEQAKEADTGKLDEAKKKTEEAITFILNLLSQVEDAAYVPIGQQLTEAKKGLAAVLNDRDLSPIREEHKDAEKLVLHYGGLHALLGRVQQWIDLKDDQKDSLPCPVCGHPSTVKDLQDLVAASLGATTEEERAATVRLSAASALLRQVTELTKTVTELELKLDAATDTLESLAGEAEALLGRKTAADQLVIDLEEARQSQESYLRGVEGQISNKRAIHDEWQNRFERLKDETDYHAAQDELRKRHRDLKDVERIKTHLTSLTEFGQTVSRLHETVTKVLSDRLRAAAPKINKALSSAFCALTNHPVYDRLYIDEQQFPQMQLLVDSSLDPYQGLTPSEVLNGQAINALELVPYFAFSELTDFPFEVYLLLLDDPTQSFDAEHIDILLQRLCQLGKSVQLVVATHEMEHFERLLPIHFVESEYRIVRVDGFSRQEGPVLASG